jgi:proteasome lid subunit RPN8/RPN11
VTDIFPLKNAELSPYSFRVEPSELIEAYETAERKGLQVIGIFHSHPGKPSPSSTDLKYMEINPVVWLIYSSTDKKFDAYIFDGEARKVQVLVRD